MDVKLDSYACMPHRAHTLPERWLLFDEEGEDDER